MADKREGEHMAQKRHGQGQLIIAGVIGILLLFFIFQNTGSVHFNFLFFTVTLPLSLMLIISMVLAIVAWELVLYALRRRGRESRRSHAEVHDTDV
jgi:uncharacterized integral membrane protein